MSGSALTSSEVRAIEHVDQAGLWSAIERLVAIESWNGNETPAQELMCAFIEDGGLELECWDIDLEQARAHPACSYEIRRDRALGVVGRLPGRGGGRSLLLNGHVDVVPPGDAALWATPPFQATLIDGRIYGRGALDMKGPLLAGLFAMRAVREAGIELRGTASLQSVVGEEDGGIGTLASILHGSTADAAIVMEPTELAVVPVQAGCVNFRVRITGRAAHGAVREEGVSAFEKAFGIYAAIQALEARRNRGAVGWESFARYATPFPISIGTMSGGDWASSVPDHVSMEGRMGVLPQESLESARAELEEAVAEAAAADEWLAAHPPAVEWWGGRFLPSALDPEHPLPMSLAGSVRDVLGVPARTEGVPFGADAGLLSQMGGIPTVLFGAGDIRRSHRPDEFVEMADLLRMARTLAVMITRWCA